MVIEKLPLPAEAVVAVVAMPAVASEAATSTVFKKAIHLSSPSGWASCPGLFCPGLDQGLFPID